MRTTIVAKLIEWDGRAATSGQSAGDQQRTERAKGTDQIAVAASRRLGLSRNGKAAFVSGPEFSL
jgi:hypothetical protein